MQKPNNLQALTSHPLITVNHPTYHLTIYFKGNMAQICDKQSVTMVPSPKLTRNTFKEKA